MKRDVSRRLRGVDIDRVDGAHENDVVNFEHRFLLVFYFVFSCVFPISTIRVLLCRRRRRFLHRWCLFLNNRFLFAGAFFLYYGGFFTIVDDIIYENRDVLTVTGFCALVLWIFFSSVMRLPDDFVTKSYVSIIICHAPA